MRRVWIALVLLLLGAVLNVAVAYACVLWSPNGGPFYLVTQSPNGWIISPTDDTPPWDSHDGVKLFQQASGFGVAWRCQSLWILDPDFALHYAWALDSGLPLGSARSGVFVVQRWSIPPEPPLSPSITMLEDTDVLIGWECPLWLARLGAHTGRPLPYTVLPAGFAANTAFYAGLVALAWYGPGLVTRRRRARRGQCLACGYDRAGLGPALPCPECGRLGVPPARTLDWFHAAVAIPQEFMQHNP